MLVLGSGQAIAAPVGKGADKGAAAPKVSPGRAVDGVFAVKPKRAASEPDPAERAFSPTATRLPAAAQDSVRVSGTAKSRAAGAPVWAQEASVGSAAAAATASSEVDVRVLDQQAAQRLGVRGVVLTASSAKAAGRVRLGVDYAGFAQAFGGNYASRLRLVQLPGCALSTPEVAACRKPTEIGSANDSRSQSVSAVVDVPAVSSAAPDGAAGARPVVSQPVVLAATAGAGEQGAAGGSYAATTLSPSGSWSGGGNSGGFTYSYPVTVPPAVSSLTPDVGLSYDSSAIDGRTASTQAQASWAGDGWSTPQSFIEQSFVSCADDPEGIPAAKKTSDLCYNGPILTMSLNGQSSSLVWDAAKRVWKAEDDGGEVITKVTGSGNGSGSFDTSYWQVTTRDGSVFQFGRNQLPGWVAPMPRTNSVDTVPVYSAHSGDPCYDQSWCVMPYRWNLDYVTDVNGNAMSYYYGQKTNFYGRDQGATSTSYVRDSWLDHIDYGFTDGNAYGTVPNKVQFTPADRCVSGTCQPLNAATKANWPDVPFDLICDLGATCGSWAPSFFSTVRLASITTKQYSTTTGDYVPVDGYVLQHTIPATGDSTSPTLWLNAITRTGYDKTAGDTTAITLPAVTFSSVKLQNRVDTTTLGLPAFYRHRIHQITTESGSVITADYDRTNPCTAPVTLTAATNTSSCYPVRWTPPSYTTPFPDWFNKWVVTTVTQTDPTGGAAPEATSYKYLGGPAWHYDENEVVKAKYRTYGQFRGYGKVQTRLGDATKDKQTLSEVTYYRGMSKNNNTTVVTVTDSQNGAHEDLDKLAGRELETTTYRGDDTTPVAEASTITSYWVSAAAATRSRTGLSALTAAWSAPAETFSRQRIISSGAAAYRNTQTDNSYNADPASITFGLLKNSYTHTAPVDTAYDRCVTNSYASVNTGKNLVGLLAETDTVSKACGGYTAGSPSSVPGSLNTLTAPTAVTRPAQVIANQRYYYDDPAFTTTFPQPDPPSRGLPTMQRQADGWTGTAYTYLTTGRADYDSYGYKTAGYDGNGYKTKTTYTLDSRGLVTSTTTTNPLNQSVTTTLDTMRGLPKGAVDANLITTTVNLDALGRTKAVWLNSRTTDLPANLLYSYAISNTGISSVTTQKRSDQGPYQISTLIYDGMLRPRQTQQLTPRYGRMVTDTFYDSRGWTKATNNGWWDDGTIPDTTLVSAANLGKQVPSQTLFTYDGLGRAVKQEQAQQNVVQPAETTTTVYAGDATTVYPPTGGTVTTTYTDPLGRTVKTDDYKTVPSLTAPPNTFTGDYKVTGGTKTTSTFGYNGQGLQDTTKDTANNPWTSTFNMLGQVTSKTDPDAGTATGLTYDNNGNLTQSTDSRHKTVSYTYDALNRKTGMFAATTNGQTAANQLAAWVYDNSDNAVPTMTYPIGHLTSSTAYWGANHDAYKIQQKNFTMFGVSRGTTVTIPPAEGALAGDYIFSRVYTADTGLLYSETFPAKGGLPQETVTHGYSGVLDMPTGVAGVVGYGTNITYDAWSRVLQQQIGTSPNYGYITNTWDPHTSRLTSQTVTRQTGTPSTVHQTDYAYDAAGNITKTVDTRSGNTATSETQCFRTDGLRRIRAAWTATDNCATEPSTGSRAMVGSNLGAASAYWNTWTFNDLGDRTSQTQYSTTGGADTTTNYAYNGNATNQPHTLTSTGTGTATTGATAYTYDTAGDMTTRNAGTGNQTLTWDDARRLTAITGSTAGNTAFVYDADNTLLLQKDPGKTTLYLPGEQITLNTSTQTQTGARYYPLPGGGTCIRTGNGTNYSFALGDQNGTPTVYLNNTMATPTWRQYTPYGAPRGTTSTYPDNRGFLNKVLNATTGLTQIGARNYDPTTGRFISLDPIFNPGDQQSWNGYAYAGNNPITMSDPSGLRVQDPDLDNQFGTPLLGTGKNVQPGERHTGGGDSGAGGCHYVRGPICGKSPGGGPTTGGGEKAGPDDPVLRCDIIFCLPPLSTPPTPKTPFCSGKWSWLCTTGRWLNQHAQASFSACDMVCVSVSYQQEHLQFGSGLGIGGGLSWTGGLVSAPVSEQGSVGYQVCGADEFAACYVGGFRGKVSDWLRKPFFGPPSTRPWHGAQVGIGGGAYAGFTYTLADWDILHGKVTGPSEP